MLAARHVRPRALLWSSSATSIRLIIVHSRFLSIPVPSPKPSSPPDAHLSPAQRKQKLDLRPAPIRPSKSTVSATYVPTKPTVPLPQPKPTPSLAAAKEEARHDVEAAEAHGVLKPPPPGAKWARRTIHKAVEIVKFYYRGVKLIFTRRKEISLIRARIRAGGSPLTRSEYRLICTQKSDINKVVPFLFIALILEEVIPLIAIYAPFMLPSTCILPSQRDRIEEQRTAKALAYSAEYRSLFAKLKHKESPAGHISLDAIKELGAVTAVCGLLRLSTTGFDALRIRRIRQHLQFIAKDDQLLVQDNLIEHLPQKGLEEALGERGIIAHGLTLKTMQSHLTWWLESIGQSTSETRRLHLLINRL